MNTSPKTPVEFKCGATMKNKFMLAPMTNTQSHADGSLSDDEFKWLSMRAEGQFGLVMTCASHVQKNGKGFSGQLGIFSSEQVYGHIRLANKIKSYGSLAVVQLHHAGMRSPSDLVLDTPVCPSDNEEHGARGLTIEEVERLKKDFIDAGVRAKQCGYDGVEVHGAHGYILTQFLSSEINKRTDQYGGSLENRARLLFEIVDGIRNRCGKDFLLGVRLSPERFGMDLNEIIEVSKRFIEEDKIDFLDISLWDIFKEPEDEKYKGKALLDYFTELDLRNVKLTVAGKIQNGEDVQKALDSGIDFVTIGRSAILHHDFPAKVMEDPKFEPTETPVSKSYLQKEGVGNDFLNYISKWDGFLKK